MSLVTVSTKRDRIYQRAFDHDECLRLRAEDPKTWTYDRLAGKFGVSSTAIARVCDPGTRERLDRNANEWARRQRTPCLGGCGTLVWHTSPDRTGYCAVCLGKERFGDAVRPDELMCRKCGEWKPDEDFHPARGKNASRRHRKTFCKACDNAARQDHRRRNRDASLKYDRNYKRKGKTLSEYIVLQKTELGDWRERTTVRAASRLHAVEDAADGPGVYAAVSAGQLNPMTVQPAQAFKVVRGEQ